ncbi:MAG: hypothetical protein MJ090_02220 [Clostridia bacterium]|nr:hypothetical protein [Clostridia bacterium]
MVIFMLALIVSFLFAVLQTFLLKKLMAAITAQDKKTSIRLFFIKFILYGVVIALFMFKFMKYATYCLCGFAAGMPLTAISLFIYYSFIKRN